MPKKGCTQVTTITVPAALAGATIEVVRARSTTCANGKRKHTELDIKRSAGIFDIYIRRLLQGMDAENRLSMSAKTVNVLDAMMTDLLQRMSTEAAKIAHYNKRKTITQSEAMAAIQLVLHGELAKRASDEGDRARITFSQMDKLSRGKAIFASRSAKAQLAFPVPRVLTHLRASTNSRVSQVAGVIVTAALEYVCNEILDMAVKALKEVDKSTVLARHIRAVVGNDRELAAVFRGAAFINS